MQPLIIYFNEQCLNHTPEDYYWDTGIRKLCNVIDEFFKVRADAHIAFPEGQWQSDCGGLHLLERLKGAYPKKDSYLRLLGKIKKLAHSNVQLSHELYWNDKSAQGLTLANATHSWAVSLFLVNTVWINASVTAQRYELDKTSGEIDGPVPFDVRHLSDIPHTLHWDAEIRDWGATVAPSCVLDKVRGHPVVMYQGPKEHNPPHVHLLDKQSRHSLAKYRIDVFERPKGPPTWDAEMKIWVARNRNQLLRSWERCQRGGLPFEIEN